MYPTIIFGIALFLSIASWFNGLSCIINRESIIEHQGYKKFRECCNSTYSVLFIACIFWLWLYYLLH